MSRAVVIGAGIAGLAAAALLRREGHQVTVIEQRGVVGGRAGLWEHDGFRFDTGPSWYLMPEVFDHFFRLLGTTAARELDLHRLEPGYRVFFEDEPEPIDVAAGRDENIRLFEQIESGAGRQLRRYLDSAHDAYRMALDTFLYTTFAAYRPLVTGRVLRRAGTLARLLTQPLDRFAARSFTDRRLRQILGYPAVFLGSDPHRTPSLYHLMSHLDLDDGVWYPAGGINQAIDAIARLAADGGAQIRTSTRAVAITTSAATHRARVTGVTVVDGSGICTTIPADIVISAADLHHTETTLLPPGLRTYPEKWWHPRSAGPGAVLAYLGIAGDLPRLAHHNLFFTRDWSKNFDAIFAKPTRIPHPASAYVCRPSASDRTVAPVGHENLFILVPVPANPGIGCGGDNRGGTGEVESVVDAAIAQIATWAHVPDLADRIVLRRTVGPGDFAAEFNSWRGGALGPAHTLRQSAMFRASNASVKVDGLLYAGGSTIPGIGLPMCLISAELVIKRLRGNTDTRPLEEPLSAGAS